VRVTAQEDGFAVHATAGAYVVHLAFDTTSARRRGLLGFAVHREDRTEDGPGYWLFNERTFAGHEGDRGSWPSNEAPLQRFRWGDYTTKPSHDYRYTVCAAYGKPGALDLRHALTLDVATEDPARLVHPDGTRHEIYFNRSGAASQAYIRRFGHRTPDHVPGGAAYNWLSRGLLEGMLAFIERAGRGDELAVAMYEFQLEPILSAFRAAVERGATVKVLYDAGTDAEGPLKKNRAAVRKARLATMARPRGGLKSYISHHKFIVLVKGGVPTAVWSGSTNTSTHALYAQLNVSHVVEDRAIAQAYYDLHSEIWLNDPSAKDTRGYLTKAYPSVRPAADANTSFVFSPRSNQEAMEFYLELMHGAKQLVVLTTPFGVDSRIEQFLRDSSSRVIKLGLIGTPGDRGGQVTRIDSIQGTRYSMPARIETVLDRWQVEQFGYQSHAYIHTKFLLVDPFSPELTLVTGSANFSRASCLNNDEDMLVIRGHPSAADVYLTEFLRMFDHYSFREFVKRHHLRHARPLAPNDEWADDYFAAGSERRQERLVFAGKA
jgi:phosphatidylserine/phosphatidylglycerophosphate/cardiolipin synthase-like enzyme